MSDPVAPNSPNSTPAPVTPAAKSGSLTKGATAAQTAAPASSTKAPVSATPSKTPHGVTSVTLDEDTPEAAPVEAKPETPAEKVKRKYKQKVDGQEIDEELDDDEVSVRLQKGRAAEKRMQEAAEIRKQYKAHIEAAKKDPFKHFSENPELGLNLEELAEKHLAEKYRREMMSEEERARLTEKEELTQLRAEREAKQAHDQAVKKEQFEEAVFKKTEAFFMETLEKHQLPKDYETLAIMSEIGLLNLEQEVELTPDQMAAEVKAKYARFGGGYKKLRGEALLAELGDELVEDIMKTKVAKLKSKTPFDPKPPAQHPGDLTDKPKRPILSTREFRNKLKMD